MANMQAEALDIALEALENNRRTHYYCEDIWYSCPKHEDGCANEAEGDECNCGADKANQEIDNAITAIKQARALDKKAENARELGLDYEPAEVLGHNGWGFPIKAAAPVQEDWGPGPHEYHSLTAAPVQEPVAFKIYKPTPPRGAIPYVRDAELPWVYDQDPSSGNVASMWVTPVKLKEKNT
jgi:hypothetical protein